MPGVLHLITSFQYKPRGQVKPDYMVSACGAYLPRERLTGSKKQGTCKSCKHAGGIS